MKPREIFAKSEQEAKVIAETMTREHLGLKARTTERRCTCGRTHNSFSIGNYDGDGNWEERALIISCNQFRLDFGKEETL